MLRTPAVNALLFVIGWTTCIAAGNSWWLLIPGIVLLVHFRLVSSWGAEGKLIVSCMLIGTTISSVMLQMDWLSMTGHTQLTPLWLALSWALVGSLLNHALRWSARPWWRASLLGAVSIPVLYLIMTQRQDVALTTDMKLSVPLLAVMGAILLPLLHGFAQLYREQYRLVRR